MQDAGQSLALQHVYARVNDAVDFISLFESGVEVVLVDVSGVVGVVGVLAFEDEPEFGDQGGRSGWWLLTVGFGGSRL